MKNINLKKQLLATAYQSHFDREGVPFTFDQLKLLALNPLNVPKGEAPLIHPSTAPGKTKEIVEVHNRMTWLWIDLDSGGKPLSEVIEICKTYQITNAVIYSTASACRMKKGVLQGFRWRVVILPSQSLSCADWQTLQTSLAKIFDDGGLEACKLTQGFYAPSCNDGGYYESALV